jgi:hypothetical protein
MGETASPGLQMRGVKQVSLFNLQLEKPQRTENQILHAILSQRKHPKCCLAKQPKFCMNGFRLDKCLEEYTEQVHVWNATQSATTLVKGFKYNLKSRLLAVQP